MKKRLGVPDKEDGRGGREWQDVGATSWRVAAAAASKIHLPVPRLMKSDL